MRAFSLPRALGPAAALRPFFATNGEENDTNEIDLPRLRADIAQAACQARELKRLLGARWTRPMAPEQRALAEHRRHATRLLILRAFLRGRWHVAERPRTGMSPLEEWDREKWHARIAERVAREYERRAAANE